MPSTTGPSCSPPRPSGDSRRQTSGPAVEETLSRKAPMCPGDGESKRVLGDVATFVTFNRIRPAASHEGSFPRTCDPVDWPRFLHPEADGPRPYLLGGAMRCRMVLVPRCTLRPERKRRPKGEDRRSICSSCSRLPRDHPPCGTPVSEGPLLVSECLYHKPTTTATDCTRLTLSSLDQEDQGPSGAPVEGGADTALALSSPDPAGWAARGP